MIEERVIENSLFFPENIHNRYSIVEHSQSDIFGRDGGKNGGLRLPVIDDRKGADVV